MNFVAIVGTTPEGRVAKFQEFDTRAAADAHVDAHGGFVFVNNGAALPHMKVDPTTRAVTIEAPPAPVVIEAPLVRALRVLARSADPAVKAEIASIIGPEPV